MIHLRCFGCGERGHFPNEKTAEEWKQAHGAVLGHANIGVDYS